MADTVLRLGLWTLILVLALFILGESFHGQPIGDMIPHAMLQQALVVTGAVLVAGIVLKILGKGAAVVSKNRCRVCRTPIPTGAIYCREHLRTILSDEDEKTHMTRIRRK
jgi:predicted nucleic acid-binding Zn ribbon protein